MTLANGRPYLAIPGPSVIPDRVLRAMHRASPNIYHGPLTEMVPGLVEDLKGVARTRHDVALYIANGHGVWEAALSNVVMEGDDVLVVATGRFSHGWGEMAEGLGARVEIMEFGMEAPFDAARVVERLEADKDHRIRAVLVVQVDTSTSVRSDIEALGHALAKTGHPALYMVDCIACLGCDRFEMDAWGVDVMVTGSQKGLMTPPGMGFVFFNDKADAARGRLPRVSQYWDWRTRTSPELFYQYFDGTAPTHHLYGLREALDMIGEEGLDAVWRRHGILARAIWAALDRWGEGGPLRANVADPAHRAHSVTTIQVGSAKGEDLRRWCEEKAGLTLGIGLGFEPMQDVFRIGHMGHVNAQMILGVIATIEAGLRAVDIPHGAGAVEAAADVIATAA